MPAAIFLSNVRLAQRRQNADLHSEHVSKYMRGVVSVKWLGAFDGCITAEQHAHLA
jgi:hypothetical protein